MMVFLINIAVAPMIWDTTFMLPLGPSMLNIEETFVQTSLTCS